MTYAGLAEFATADGREVARAVVNVYRNGRWVAELHPRRDYYVEQQQPMTIPGVRSSLTDDFYVLLVGWQPIGVGGATFKVYLNPLINLVWLGGLVFILGTLVAAWPETEPEYARRAERAAMAAAAAPGADLVHLPQRWASRLTVLRRHLWAGCCQTLPRSAQ